MARNRACQNGAQKYGMQVQITSKVNEKVFTHGVCVLFSNIKNWQQTYRKKITTKKTIECGVGFGVGSQDIEVLPSVLRVPLSAKQFMGMLSPTEN